MIAAFAFGPKQGIPSISRISTMPIARGSSGVTTQKSTFSFLASSTILAKSIALTLTHLASAAMPPLPGAQIISSIVGFSFSLRMIACSRPPEPITKTFIDYLLLMME